MPFDFNVGSSPIRRISVVLPIVMSTAALSMVLVHYMVVGITHETDEGTLAHLFQLLIVGQLPFVAYCAAVQLAQLPTRSPARMPKVLLLQVAAVAAAILAARELT